MNQNLDVLWKSLLEDTFADFLRFMNPNVDELLDLRRGIHFMDAELKQTFRPADGLFAKAHTVDKLASVYTKGGTEELVLVHIEVQGQYTKDFAKRMFGYYYRLLDKYDRRITAYAIFLESNTIVRPDFFEQEFMGTSIRYKFNVLKIADLKEDELMASQNPFALAALAARSAEVIKGVMNPEERDAVMMAYHLNLVKILLQRDYPKTKIKALMDFLFFYVKFANKELMSKFESNVNSLINYKHKTMGVSEAVVLLFGEQGQGLGDRLAKESFIRNLIRVKGWADEEIATVVDTSLEFIRKVRTTLEISN